MNYRILGMNVREILFLILSCQLFFSAGCHSESIAPNLKLEVSTTKETQVVVIKMVEKFASQEKLRLIPNTNNQALKEMVRVHYVDESPITLHMAVTNLGLEKNNKDHVEISITMRDKDKNCDICRRFEESAEMKEIKSKFQISNVVKKGNW